MAFDILKHPIQGLALDRGGDFKAIASTLSTDSRSRRPRRSVPYPRLAGALRKTLALWCRHAVCNRKTPADLAAEAS